MGKMWIEFSAITFSFFFFFASITQSKFTQLILILSLLMKDEKKTPTMNNPSSFQSPDSKFIIV